MDPRHLRQAPARRRLLPGYERRYEKNNGLGDKEVGYGCHGSAYRGKLNRGKLSAREPLGRNSLVDVQCACVEQHQGSPSVESLWMLKTTLDACLCMICYCQ